MSEKRIYKRMHLIYYLKVMDTKTDELVGFVVDITPEGMMIMSETDIEVGRVFNFKILMKNDTDESEFLCFDARSKWCRKDDSGNFYDCGFELLNVDYKNVAKIEDIIRTLCFSDEIE